MGAPGQQQAPWSPQQGVWQGQQWQQQAGPAGRWAFVQRIAWRRVGSVAGLLLFGCIIGLALGWLLFGGEGSGSSTALATFQLKDVQGKEQDFGSLAKGKPTVLLFWSSEANVDAHFDMLQNLAETDNLVVVTVNSDQSRSKVNDHVKGRWSKLVFLIDDDGKVKEDHGITSLPTFILYDSEGAQVERLGSVGADELKAKITEKILE